MKCRLKNSFFSNAIRLLNTRQECISLVYLSLRLSTFLSLHTHNCTLAVSAAHTVNVAFKMNIYMHTHTHTSSILNLGQFESICTFEVHGEISEIRVRGPAGTFRKLKIASELNMNL